MIENMQFEQQFWEHKQVLEAVRVSMQHALYESDVLTIILH